MASRNRRTFLKQLGLTVGAVAIGSGPASALVHYQKRGIARTPAEPAPALVDFRHSPASWRSPICLPGDRFKSLVTETSARVSPGGQGDPAAGGDVISFRIGGEAQITRHSVENPSIPFVGTAVSSNGTKADIVAFSSTDGDGGRVDHLEITYLPAPGAGAPEIIVSAPGDMRTENEEDDDFPSGGVCFVRTAESPDRVLLAVNAACTSQRRGGEYVLTPVTGGDPGIREVRFLIAIPLTGQDEGDLRDVLEEWDRHRRSTGEAWNKVPATLPPVGWELWNEYDRFRITSVRLIEQMRTPPDAKGIVVDVFDEHFTAEAEHYTGRDAEARSRLENIWNLQTREGMIVGAGGESDWKQTALAVYALCRHAELSGDWKLFDELFPDSYNAMMEFRNMAERARTAGTSNGKLGILPEGSPGPGWDGVYEEFTGTVWTLTALRLLLEISDRLFLPKKSSIREFYGQLRAAFIAAARSGVKTDAGGVPYFPMIYGTTSGGGTYEVRPQSSQDALAEGICPGWLFLPDDAIVKNYHSLMESVLVEDVPVGTVPGPGGAYRPEAAALLAQTYLWTGNSAAARRAFVGFLNHASPVRTWERVQYIADGTTSAVPERGGMSINVRASAECLRYLRHMLVLEDKQVLRLLDGVTETDLADAQPMRLIGTPTRWGRVTLTHEPIDPKAWKTTFRLEPVNPEKAPTLSGIEMPRRLTNFQFASITGTTAIKNGPRVYIEGSATEWECTWRDFRRD